MKKIISLLVVSVITTNMLFAQSGKLKTKKPSTSFSEVSGIGVEENVKRKTKTIISPRDAASGQATGKRKQKSRKKN